MAETPLASLSLTHVHYNPSDPLSYLSAWLALVPQGLCVVYVTLFITSREIEIALAFGGQLSCEVVNFALKRLIKEKRPDRVHHLGKGYGMPSSHAQFMAFWSIYVSLWLWFRFSPRKLKVEFQVPSAPLPPTEINSGSDIKFSDESGKSPKHKHKKSKSDSTVQSTLSESSDDKLHIDTSTNVDIANDSWDWSRDSPPSEAYKLQLHHPLLTKFVLSAVLLSLAGAVCISRTYLEYHTAKQVYVGACAGTAFATAFFIATEIARRWGFVDMVLEYPWVRHLRVRDLACEEDLIELGWSVWERKRKERRKARKRRKSVRFSGLPDLVEEVKSVPKVKKSSDEKKDKKKKKV